MDKTAPLIEFENFSFQYQAQKQPTLKNINLRIHAGEKVLIVGPSGCGKSTLTHCINGLIPFNYPGEITGKLTVAGTETKDSGMFELSRTIGTVLQDPDGQFVGLTAGEDIAFSLENNCTPQGEMYARVRQAADTVGVGALLDQSPYDLSGGQKQRVSMAGVIIDRVQVLLFDEPLASLDPATGKQAIELIDEIMAQSQTAVIIIEHRLEDVLHRHVDRLILMEEGQIVADMPPAQLLVSGLLKKSGIREPLYLTALRFAGVPIAPDMHPDRIDQLSLDEAAIERVRTWYESEGERQDKPGGAELLRVEALDFSYVPGTPVLDGISFSIGEGEMLAVVGTNGAGKSTLAKLICGFERPTGGRILHKGRDMAGDSITQRAQRIGYVMQNPNQMISKTMIYDEVALGLLSRGLDEAQIREQVEATMRICGLYAMRNWPISALSYGQKKRVTIASVLVTSPDMIILDEPTAGQDFRHYTEIMEFLRQLNGRGITVMMITHDMHLMLEYAPRALVFAGGKLIGDGSAARILTSGELARAASLNTTSLYALARLCGIEDATRYVQKFIDADREVRPHG